MTMTKSPHRALLVLAFAIGFAGCDGRSPSAPPPLPGPSPTPVALTVTAIAPSTGSTARPTVVTISGTGFLTGATVTVGVTASATVLNSTTITAVVLAHAAEQADVVVTNPSGSAASLASAFTYTFDEPFTLTPSVSVIDAGGQMSVSWTAPAGRANDWIAVFKVGASYDDDWWFDTNGATSGTHTVTAPTQPGQYEFRYLFDGNFLEGARSSPFTVR
jgi:hypothetical protein